MGNEEKPKKWVIYLTDLKFHTRAYRPTIKFVPEKGRVYVPFQKTEDKEISTPTLSKDDTGTFSIVIEWPEEWKERIENGDVEIMVPKEGLFVFAGEDAIETLTKMKAKERIEIIHRNRKNTWHSNDSGVK